MPKCEIAVLGFCMANPARDYPNRSIKDLCGQFLRQAAVLTLVLTPVEMAISADGVTNGGIIAIAVVSLGLFGAGVWLEVTRTR